MGRHFGWSAVTDRPMTHDEFLLALQLLAEERYGTKARAAKREENSAAARAAKALG